MKYIFASWAAPMVVFWGWFFLSLNDMNFGYRHAVASGQRPGFQLYGDILGIDPEIIPPMVARACVFDGFVLGGDLGVPPPPRAFRLGARQLRALFRGGFRAQRLKPVEHALQDEGGGGRIDAARPLLA